MSNFGGRLSQPKKSKPLLGISFFCQHNSTGAGFLILKQIYYNEICALDNKRPVLFYRSELSLLRSYSYLAWSRG
jgi:hypothetical protein